jgi:hypothetical protein
VAEILSARGIPFVFVTGYEAETVDNRFSGIPILQKPIERQTLQRMFFPGVNGASIIREGIFRSDEVATSSPGARVRERAGAAGRIADK